MISSDYIGQASFCHEAYALLITASLRQRQ